ncbi:hypothetical protein BDY21DRAFT_352056 [Lineolata rhizophorae]|uniref:Uncharacterized protein n=1 Tax=Lineolata rhizophorae TaxID=578093 RepID=A0A6A6NU60_9PEZI|nr:hypothetical protein BDY21DRAFT_352056 [Lineolata rhizophorae]
MEFVLTLESPCFNHVGNPKEAQHAPHGHALMATAPLLLQAPEAPKALLSSHASWQVPDTGIERLLSLSSNLPLDGDVTPIQAWDYIRKQPGFENLELSRLRELTEKLLNFVKCYGFGSVMGQSDFENIVTDTFSRPTPAGYAY